ncbi:MAG: hypothetical protein H6599_07350 [Flavobacteriales bacterium]|nr:hypothetical protein [Flavobacteriales bacterium]
MRYTTLLFLSTLFFASCKESESTEETTAHNEVQEVETVQNVEMEIHQTNVVTPEFWENFDTDVRVVFFYSKKESSSELIQKLKKEIVGGEEALNYVFHEYHTDDNMGMVQVDDNIFFNLTEYLWNNEEGFVLLRKGAILHIPASELNEQDGLGSQVADFFI